VKRYLTLTEAQRCEFARETVCKCRCGGAKHGAARISNGDYSVLPADDPHYRPVMTKAETLSFLRRAVTHVTFSAGDFFSRDLDTSWRDALATLGQAIKDVKQP